MRVTLPDFPVVCTLARRCPYRERNGICYQPRYNKRNSDAACHRLTNTVIASWMEFRQGRPGKRIYRRTSSNALPNPNNPMSGGAWGMGRRR